MKRIIFCLCLFAVLIPGTAMTAFCKNPETAVLADWGKGAGGKGIYLICPQRYPAFQTFDPDAEYLAEYVVYRDCVRKDIAEKIDIRVFETGSKEERYCLSIETDLVFPEKTGHLYSFRRDGKEYLEIGKAAEEGERKGEWLVLEPASGALFWESGDSSFQRFEEANARVSKTACFSTLYTNLLWKNGYEGVRAFSRDDGFVIDFVYGQAKITNPSLFRFFGLDEKENYDEESYFQFILPNEEGLEGVILALFGNEQSIRWEEAVIFGNASYDGREHPIRSPEDFDGFYQFDEEGQKRTGGTGRFLSAYLTNRAFGYILHAVKIFGAGCDSLPAVTAREPSG